MVKGITKQVVLVHSPDRKLFEQAIFILSDEATAEGGVTDEALLKEARFAIREKRSYPAKINWNHVLAGSVAGTMFTSALWVISLLL